MTLRQPRRRAHDERMLYPRTAVTPSIARRLRAAVLSALVVAFAACNSEPPAATGPDTFVLDDGTEVRVAGNGGVTLVDRGRAVFTMSPRDTPTAHVYEESFKGFVGIWDFERDGDRKTPLGRVTSREGVGSAAVVRFVGDDDHAGGSIEVSTLRPGASRVRIEVSVAGARSVSVPLACGSESTFYGFGEQYESTDQRGEAFELFVSEQGIGRDPAKPRGGLNGDRHTTYFPMPYFLDARGFGALVRTSRRVLVDLCKGDAQVAWLEVTSGEPVDIVVFHGPTPLDVVRELGDEVGRPKAPPPWAYGMWLGAEGGRDTVVAQADALDRAGISATAIWAQDWSGARQNLDGGYGVQYRWKADDALYPDLAGMVAGLHARGLRFLAYANPFVVPRLDHHDEMGSQGLLIRRADGSVYDHIAPNGAASQPDLTNPDAREYVKSFLRRMVGTYGIDGWMSDFGEWLPLDARLQSGIDAFAYHNLYPVEWHRLTREVMDELRPDGDWVMFGRSGFTGVQSVGMIQWVGDQEASFDRHDGLPTVVPAMLTLGMSGMPYVTHDIAGFSGGPSTKELFLRWTELGAFTPIMRTHPGAHRDQNWAWDKDEETTRHFRRFTNVHAALAPTFQALAADAATTGAPILRHLMLAFPDDPRSRHVDDEMMIGNELLVAPVVAAGVMRREVYLPPGSWFDVWSGARHEGGQTIEVDAPIGSPPVFARDRDRQDLRAIR